jgi:hypothetical protein
VEIAAVLTAAGAVISVSNSGTLVPPDTVEDLFPPADGGAGGAGGRGGDVVFPLASRARPMLAEFDGAVTVWSGSAFVAGVGVSVVGRSR